MLTEKERLQLLEKLRKEILRRKKLAERAKMAKRAETGRMTAKKEFWG